MAAWSITFIGILQLCVLHTLHQHPGAAAGRGENEDLQIARTDSRFCGNWQKNYTKVHREILSGTRPPRYAIALLPTGGLCDRLIGVVTVFMFALLTDRAIQIGGALDQQAFEWVYSAPNVNWTMSEANAALLPQNMLQSVLKWEPELLPDALSGDLWRFYEVLEPELSAEHSTKREVYNTFLRGPLEKLEEEKQNIFILINRGLTVRLFNNPHHRKRLESLGLTRTNAFGCAMEYLFRPKQHILESIAAEAKIVQDPRTFTIAIQIRLGDHVFYGPKSLSDPDIHHPDIAKFFACAEQLERTLPSVLQKHQVIWLLASDSVMLRQAAVHKYGQKLVTRLEHVGHSAKTHSQGAKFSFKDLESLKSAVAENWLLGQADAHIISAESSFGRTAAFRARNPEGWLFTLSKGETALCGAGSHSTFGDAGQHYAGI